MQPLRNNRSTHTALNRERELKRARKRAEKGSAAGSRLFSALPFSMDFFQFVSSFFPFSHVGIEKGGKPR
jgi:hypothetical protein